MLLAPALTRGRSQLAGAQDAAADGGGGLRGGHGAQFWTR